jgi:Ca2+/Na+ antiporter
MTYNQKLNAISRTILILTLLSFLFTRRVRILIIGAIILVSIYLLHFYKTKEEEKTNELKQKTNATGTTEGFENPGLEVLKKYPNLQTQVVFDTPTSSNPFSNVLIPDYEYNPNKKPAPPSFNTNINDTILKQAKEMVIQSNPGQPDIADKLFKDLGEQFVFEQSLQPFYSNPATTIPNDQAGFADFCYGSMVSCKEGNLFACARNLDRYTN